MDVHSTVRLKLFLGEVQNVTYIPPEVKMSKQPTGTSTQLNSVVSQFQYVDTIQGQLIYCNMTLAQPAVTTSTYVIA